MNDEDAFASFCAHHARQQTRDGLTVPPAAPPSFAYFQWLEVARQRFHETKAEQERDDSPQRRRRVDGAGNALADALAQQLASSLEKQTCASRVPASLRHAVQEPFPMPPAAADMPAFLTLAEAAARLALWNGEDERIAYLAGRIRPNLHSLELKGVVGAYAGCFPSLQILMDLLSWRIIVHRWDRLAPKMRRMAVDEVLILCSYVEAPVTKYMRAAVKKLDVSSATVSVPESQLDSLASLFSAFLPFEFSACRDVLRLYAEPAGVLHVPGSSPAPSRKTAAASPITAETGSSAVPAVPAVQAEVDAGDDDDVCLGDMLGDGNAHRAPEQSPPADAAATEPLPSPSHVYEAHPVLDVVPRSSGTLRGPRNSSSGSVAAASTPKHQPACASRYHHRYASAFKHASPECRYCATCHLMEILFGGDTRDCPWHHWPTERKVNYHLKSFPDVLKLALERFHQMECGIRLAATDEVPL